MKIKYFSLKGGVPSKSATEHVWFTDFLTVHGQNLKPVNRAAYDLFYYENFDGFISFWWVYKKLSSYVF